MSDVDREARTWQLYIQDMIDFGDKAFSYTDGLDQEQFIWSLSPKRQPTYRAKCAMRIVTCQPCCRN